MTSMPLSVLMLGLVSWITGFGPFDVIADAPNSCCDCACRARYPSGGWQVYETKNFRLHYHSQEPRLADVAKLCEGSRNLLHRQWLDTDDSAAWSPKCDVFLYWNPADYVRSSGNSAETRGTSSMEVGLGKVWNRRIHLRVDQPGYVESVLPHELTHVVLADRFCNCQIPRWADEGIAMLSEPPARRQALDQLLRQTEASGATIPLRELLTAMRYPTDPGRAQLFFAQSVSFADYVVRQSSGTHLVRMIEAAQRGGYDFAVRNVFGIDGVNAMESNWRAWLASDSDSHDKGN
jgi:hypothetical protein